ncbi:unnamed protein product [Prunus brigantina]
MKSNYDIVRLIQDYDTKMRKFKFYDGDSEMKGQDVAEIFGLPNRGKKLPSTTTSTRLDLHFVKKYFMGSKKITKTSIDKCLNLALEDETKEDKKNTKVQEEEDAAEEVNEEENEDEDDAFIITLKNWRLNVTNKGESDDLAAQQKEQEHQENQEHKVQQHQKLQDDLQTETP